MKLPLDRIVIVDEAISEIPDPEFAIYQGKAPGGIEVAI